MLEATTKLTWFLAGLGEDGAQILDRYVWPEFLYTLKTPWYGLQPLFLHSVR